MHTASIKPALAPPQERGVFRSPGERKLLYGLLLLTITLALYNPASRNGFVNFDDDRYVTENSHVRAGLHWSTIAWAFTSLEQANWHPLTWLSHALDCQIFRLNPAGHHYTSLLLHAANVLLLFLILQWFTGSIARSFWVAALFAAHPLNVESVAWVAERKTVLSMLFFLTTLAAYGWYVRKPGSARYLLVALMFAMALMSKPMAITLPFVLLLLDYWPLGRMGLSAPLSANVESDVTPPFAAHNPAHIGAHRRPLWTLSLEKFPLLALSAGSAIITMIAQRAGGAVLAAGSQRSVTLRLENVVVSYALYIRKAAWPSHLTILYPFPRTLPVWEVVASAAVLLTFTLAVWKYRERRYLTVGWFWYLGTMVPMIGLIQVGNQAMADRYAYLPMIGLFIMAVWGSADFAGAVRFLRPGVSAKILAVVGTAILVAFSILTRLQINYWHDDFTLWSHALAVTHDNFVAENNFADALIKHGRYDDAITHFRAAAAIEPSDATSQLNLGIYAQEHGDLQHAAARYEYVLTLAADPQLRGSAYANLGTVYFALRDYPQARRNFDSAMKLKWVYPIALLDLGLISERTAQTAADWNEAAGYYKRFVDNDPSDVGYLLLAHALRQAGREAEAIQAFQQASRLSKNILQAQQKAATLVATQ